MKKQILKIRQIGNDGDIGDPTNLPKFEVFERLDIADRSEVTKPAKLDVK